MACGRQVAIFEHEVPARGEYLLVEILDEGFDEWRANRFDAFFEPLVLVEEVTLAGEDAQVHGEVKVLAEDDLN